MLCSEKVPQSGGAWCHHPEVGAWGHVGHGWGRMRAMDTGSPEGRLTGTGHGTAGTWEGKEAEVGVTQDGDVME